jgi:NADH:ubiquinone oxidoreductase subunit 6 (subunit J)
MPISYIALTVTILAAAATAVLSKSMLQSAVALGIGSVARATLFFLLGAPLHRRIRVDTPPNLGHNTAT